MDLSIHDLGFERVPVECDDSRGAPFIRWGFAGMPSLPPHVLDCVVYLYRSREGAEAGEDLGGTGFLVTVPSPSGIPDHVHSYVVTNHHVAIKTGASVARINGSDGSQAIFDLAPEDWTFLPGQGDVAAAPIDIADRLHKIRTVPLEMFLTREEFESGVIGIGEDVFMIGRFMDHDGVTANMPALRFGNISIGPAPIARMNNSRKVEYICLDMHSRTGFSGSPVIAYKTMSNDLTSAFLSRSQRPAKRAWQRPIVKLLGIHCGQFPEENEFTNSKGKPVKISGWSGMNSVLPAWRIADLLNCDALKAKRAQIAALHTEERYPMPEAKPKRKAPVPESATDADKPLTKKQVKARFERTLKTMLATPPDPKRGPGRG